MIDNKGIELWQETNKLLGRIAAAAEKLLADAAMPQAAPCAGKETGHDWELVDERAPHMGYRCTRCGMEAA